MGSSTRRETTVVAQMRKLSVVTVFLRSARSPPASRRDPAIGALNKRHLKQQEVRSPKARRCDTCKKIQFFCRLSLCSLGSGVLVRDLSPEFGDGFGGRVNLDLCKLRICLLIAALSITNAFAQKVSVGYDKGVDFSRYTSYTWAKPTTPPTRPLLYASVVGSIDYELKAKGLARMEENGDLILIPAGGMEFGLNNAVGTPIISSYSGPPPAIDATMWTGAGGPSNLMATYVPEGTLMLYFVDRGSNKVIWTGTVKQKLDLENKNKSLDLVDKAITKLLKEFPPKKK